jgi:hypothetical protein
VERDGSRRTDRAIEHRRGSRQLKAIGSGGGPDNLCLMTDVFYSYGNSENNKAAQVRLIEDDNVVKRLE